MRLKVSFLAMGALLAAGAAQAQQAVNHPDPQDEPIAAESPKPFPDGDPSAAAKGVSVTAPSRDRKSVV